MKSKQAVERSVWKETQAQPTIMPELLAGSHHPGVLAVYPSVLEEHPSCPSPREVETSCPHQALPRWSDGENLSYSFLEWLGSKTVDN